MLDLTGGATPTAVLEVLSLIVWTLIPITSIKYVTIAMRVDHDGEGSILACSTCRRRITPMQRIPNL